jgi:glycosyltransferase involved in cell wall biosynthesis
MQLHKDKQRFYIAKNIFGNRQLSFGHHSCVTHLCHKPTGIMNILLIISVLVLIAYAILILYYRIGWSQVPYFENVVSESAVFISVIIPARNESKNLPALLYSLEQQHYPKEYFEVIVVDDFSTDDTASIAQQHAIVKYLSLQDFISGDQINSYKKKAIEIGIQHSKGALIVTTDADCFTKPEWLQTINSFYQQQKPQIIVMPVAIDCSMKAIEIFQALDFMTLQGITAASVHKKIHSMCNGANLAYTREAFDVVNGFAGIDKIASGDDMLLMHKIAKKYPGDVHYLKSKNVIVQTAPVHTVKEFFNQRIRWASKADKYDDKRIFIVLLLVYVFNVLMLLLPIWSLVNGQWSLLCNWWILLVAKTVIEMIFLIPVARFFNKSPLLWFFPVAQPFHILYTVIAGWLGKFGNYTWKERKVK